MFSDVYKSGIDFIDIGCSANLDAKWNQIVPMINYIGFDPNEKECDSLRSKNTAYKTKRFLPYAISGSTGSQTLYKTKSMYCYSLLKPNYRWLKRFSCYELFEEAGSEEVNTTTINSLVDKENICCDVMKMDSQGVEMPILKSATKILPGVICIDCETGFIDNYENESLFSDVDVFLRAQNFLMFDIKINRISYNNKFSAFGKHQPLWCNSLWMKNYLETDNSGLNRIQAFKALLLCKTLGFIDYGYAIGEKFFQDGLLKKKEMNALKQPGFWSISDQQFKMMQLISYVSVMENYKDNFSNEFLAYIGKHEKTRLLIFGSGGCGQTIYKFIDEYNRKNKTKHRVQCFIDNNVQKHNTKINDIMVLKPKKQLFKNIDKIMIGVTFDQQAIKNQLESLGVKEKNIIMPFMEV